MRSAALLARSGKGCDILDRHWQGVETKETSSRPDLCARDQISVELPGEVRARGGHLLVEGRETPPQRRERARNSESRDFLELGRLPARGPCGRHVLRMRLWLGGAPVCRSMKRVARGPPTAQGRQRTVKGPSHRVHNLLVHRTTEGNNP